MHGGGSSEDLEFEGQNIFTEEQFSYDTSKYGTGGQSPPVEAKSRNRKPTKYYLSRISKEQAW